MTGSALAGQGKKSILLVDDDDLVRDLGERILKRAGYHVLTAANGKEALQVYKREQGKVALVILDLNMPEMGGKQCTRGTPEVRRQSEGDNFDRCFG